MRGKLIPVGLNELLDAAFILNQVTDAPARASPDFSLSFYMVCLRHYQRDAEPVCFDFCPV